MKDGKPQIVDVLNAVAQVLNDEHLRPDGIVWVELDQLAERMADRIGTLNPMFNRSLWLERCGNAVPGASRTTA